MLHEQTLQVLRARVKEAVAWMKRGIILAEGERVIVTFANEGDPTIEIRTPRFADPVNESWWRQIVRLPFSPMCRRVVEFAYEHGNKEIPGQELIRIFGLRRAYLLYSRVGRINTILRQHGLPIRLLKLDWGDPDNSACYRFGFFEGRKKSAC